MEGTDDPAGATSPAEPTGGEVSAADAAEDRPDQSLDLHDAIDVVARRFDFLMALSDGPVHRPVLQSELDVSRSTAYKGIRELEERDLVERVEDGYRASPLGELLIAQYERFRTNVETVCGNGRLLSELPPGSDVSVALLCGAETVHSEPHAPHHPFRTLESMVDGATSVRAMTPVVLPGYGDLFESRPGAGALEAELLLARPVVEWFDRNRWAPLADALRTGTLTVREVDGTLPYGLVVVDAPTPRVGVFVHDERGDLRGAFVNDTDAALAWAGDVWDRFRDRSTPVAAADLAVGPGVEGDET